MFEVTTVTIEGKPTAIGSAGPYTLVVDRPAEAGGGGLGFNGGELLYLAVAGCISNDLFREAKAKAIDLARVKITVRGDFTGSPCVSTEITYNIEVDGAATPEQLRDLVQHVDRIAEIPNSLRLGTAVRVGEVQVGSRRARESNVVGE